MKSLAMLGSRGSGRQPLCGYETADLAAPKLLAAAARTRRLYQAQFAQALAAVG